jgi:uncharacterized protein (DUF302 family)
MAGHPLRAIAWILVGMLLMGAIVWFTMPALMVIQHKSPRDYQATVAALQQAIAAKQDWKIPLISDFQKTINESGHGPIDKVGSIALCNPRYASRILADPKDRKVTAFMPLSIGVYEDGKGQVYISQLDVGLMGMMFGGTIAEVMATAGKDLSAVIAAAVAK